jgi:dihydrodipicolinate synthase/N-acetylneuraminate lyase
MQAILRMRGIDVGHPRSPLVNIDDASKVEVKTVLEKLNLL